MGLQRTIRARHRRDVERSRPEDAANSVTSDMHYVTMRRPRDLDTSDRFHVYNRGADRQDIFSLPSDKHLFLALLADAADRCEAFVEAFALMTNHYHLIIRSEGVALRELMHLVGSRYAAAYNQRTNRTGPVFDSRFRSVPIVGETHLAASARYIHQNPLAFVPAAALAAYDASSLAVYLGRRTAPDWLDTSVLTTMIDPATYLAVVLDLSEADVRPLNGFDPIRRIGLEDIDRVVGSLTGRDPVMLRSPSKVLAITVATELHATDVMNVAEHYQLTPNSVRKAARRGRVLELQDVGFARTKQRVIEFLAAA